MSSSFARIRRSFPDMHTVVAYLVLTAMAAVLLIPFIYMMSIALSSDGTVSRNAFTILPREWEWINFARVFTAADTGRYILNSTILCGLAILGQVIASAFIAYGFARLRARASAVVFMILLGTMMIPQEVTMIPQFLIFKRLGLINTIWPLVLPNFFGGAFNVFLLRQNIMRIPKAFDEAALVEGAGYLTIWWRLILPMVKPVLIAITIFTFSWNWGWFTGPLIYLSESTKFPLALGIFFITETSRKGAIPPWNLIMVSSVLLAIPMLLVYAFGQKYVYSANIGSSGVLK